MQVFFKMIAQFLLLPLLKDGISWLYKKTTDYVVEKKEAKRVKTEAKKKLQEHRDAKTREERRRTFGGLSILAFCFLSFGFGSCSSVDRQLNLVTENCELDVSEVEIDGKRYVDISDSICFCRDYKFSIGHVGPVGVVTDHPYEYCKQMPGFTKWDDVTIFWETVRGKIDNATRALK